MFTFSHPKANHLLTRRRAIAGLAALTLSRAQARAQAPLPANVEVVFREPEHYTDNVRPPGSGRTSWLDDLGVYLRRQAARVVPADDRLVITITDVQRAGFPMPSSRWPGEEIRIVRDVDSPRIDLEFRLAGPGGEVLKAGSRRLQAIEFAADRICHRDEPLADEKTLIDRWLRQEFGAPGRATRPAR